MKFAYLIVAHKNPDQFIRLIQALDSEQSVFFIHIDKKANIELFKKVESVVSADKITWLKRKSIIWAGFNMIRVTLDAMREIIRSGNNYSHITLLSGQDYPIKPIESYHNYLLANPGKDYLETSKMPRPNWGNGGLDRIQYYHLIFPKFRVAYPLLSYLNVKLRYKEGGKVDMIKKLISIMPKRKDFPRKFLAGTTPYEGSQWFTISLNSAKKVIEFLDTDKEFYKYFKFTHVADEIFFPTMFMNKNINTAENIINDNLRYINWREYTGHPDTITSKDYNELVESTAFFARKFEMDQSEDVLLLIDKNLLNAQTQHL